MANISLTNVTKVHSANDGREVTAVNELNLEIQDREFVVLAGLPKCGLSTVVRLIAGLDNITRGEISIGGCRVDRQQPKDREVAVVFHDYLPYPRMSVRDNLAFGLKLRKFSSAETKKRVLGAAEVLGLQEILENKPESLSIEQRQRLALARAVALQPKVYLFDEPLLNLEPKRRGQIRNEIRKLHLRLQATMIYATHDPVEAMAIGDRIVVLHDGVLQQDAPRRIVYDKPEDTVVARFLGDLPMNLIEGTLKHDGDWLLFSEKKEGTIEARLPIADFSDGQALAGKPVLLGIRPEDVRIMDTSKAERYSGSFPAIIDFVEETGATATFYLQTGAHNMRCQIMENMGRQEVGHRAQFQLNLGKARLFDPVSGRRLC